MECPFCCSAVDDKALVCKFCKRDLYLFKPLLAKVKELETKLAEQEDPAELKTRIEELEVLLASEQSRHELKEVTPWRTALDIGQFIFIPLALLLTAHALITVVYDFNMLYLRIASVILPMPFGFYLFHSRKRSLLGWFLATTLLAGASVIGMSAITAWVDHTPVMPQSLVEWREFIEYAASITFSFMTGMLLGGVAYQRSHPSFKAGTHPLLSALVSRILTGVSSPKEVRSLIKSYEEIGSSLVAAGTTVLSIYTGLKAFM